MTPATLDWIFWLLGGLLAALGLVLGTWALFWDRAKRGGVVRRRCPRCWYDMAGVPGLKCPECGRTAKTERRLFKTRRRWRWSALAGAVWLGGAALFAIPFYRGDDWIRHVPSSILIWITPADWSRMPPPQYWGWSRVPTTTRPGTRPPSNGERCDAETWRRLYAGELARWQSQILLDRCFRRSAVKPWAIEFPERWPEKEAVPVRVSSAVTPVLTEALMLEMWTGDEPPKGRHGEQRPRNESLYPLNGTALRGTVASGRDRVHTRLWIGDRVVYRRTAPIPTIFVPMSRDLMDPVRTSDATEIVRAAVSVRVRRAGDRLTMLMDEGSGALGLGFAALVRGEIRVGERVAARTRGWKAVFGEPRNQPQELPMECLPGGLDLAMSPDAVVRIWGSVDIAALNYMDEALDPSDNRCWAGEFTVPLVWVKTRASERAPKNVEGPGAP